MCRYSDTVIIRIPPTADLQDRAFASRILVDIADWPLSDGNREKADVHSGVGAGGSNAREWWIADWPLSGDPPG
jgi:hypothetical protein